MNSIYCPNNSCNQSFFRNTNTGPILSWGRSGVPCMDSTVHLPAAHHGTPHQSSLHASFQFPVPFQLPFSIKSQKMQPTPPLKEINNDVNKFNGRIGLKCINITSTFHYQIKKELLFSIIVSTIKKRARKFF